MDKKQSGVDLARRDVLKTIGVSAAAATFGTGVNIADATAAPRRTAANAPQGPYNILFILTDQERYFRPGELPRDYRLPGRERLAKKGTVFENHRINSCVCTPSRSVLYTG